MSTAAPPQRRTFPWWVVLCVVGLDYFSSLAYLPSIAVELLGELAPIAGLGVVVITLLAALPVYWYVVGRSHHGQGGIGLLERNTRGWRGKLMILALLGFVATDFVITRTLSTSDAGIHVAHNAMYKRIVHKEDEKDAKPEAKPEPKSEQQEAPKTLLERVLSNLDEPLIVTLVLVILTFAMYFFLVTSLDHGFVSIAVGVVVLYLAVNFAVIGSALQFLFGTQDGMSLVREWEQKSVSQQIGDLRKETSGPLLAILKLALLTFPAMAIGLSGFELSMASAPLVNASPSDDPKHPAGRIFRTRLLMLVAAVLMGVLVVSSIFVVTVLIHTPQPGMAHGLPPEAVNRSLSYLAHGSDLYNGITGKKIEGHSVFPFAGPAFGLVYDISTVLILCLAGASATISLKQLVPEFLNKFGMQMAWAHRFGIIIHLFNGVILIVTVLFKASVQAQQYAYAASVLALLFGASLAAFLDVRKRLKGSWWRWPAKLPFLLITLLFAAMGLLIVYQNFAGVAIALLFVVVVLLTAITSRFMRATEPRFVAFHFANDESKTLWEDLRMKEFQILVPHDPTSDTLRHTEDEIRHRHRLPEEIPVIFVEVHLGDPSDFLQKPLMRVERDGRDLIIRVSRCTSIAHVLAAIALDFRAVGKPPELHFGWSEESPMRANLNFLLFGQGNIPWLVRALIKRAEPDPVKQPRVIVG